MADEFSATIIPLHQPTKKRPKTAAERAAAYRARKKLAAETVQAFVTPSAPEHHPEVTFVVTSRRPMASYLLFAAAMALAGVGITANGWFARSLGASEAAGWLFLALGVAADSAALAMPSCASQLWASRHRATALIGWAVWATTFAFAVTAGMGFASINISDVTQTRAGRVTPAIVTAEAALADALAARDRECKGGVGKFCRERESVVNDRRQALDGATASVRQGADPQVEAAVRIVTWLSRGALAPSGEDLAMLRLVLLALLPQLGGILLMVGRATPRAAASGTS